MYPLSLITSKERRRGEDGRLAAFQDEENGVSTYSQGKLDYGGKGASREISFPYWVAREARRKEKEEEERRGIGGGCWVVHRRHGRGERDG